MGKKRKKPITRELPFVSLCTPTYNRRVFISQMIKNVEKQDYPKNKFEWIIIDDGSDPIEDIIQEKLRDENCKLNIKYHKYNQKLKKKKKKVLPKK